MNEGGFWRESGGCLYEDPAKRPHDGSEPQLPNKKQALQVSNDPSLLWSESDPPKLVGFDDTYYVNPNPNPNPDPFTCSFDPPTSTLSYLTKLSSDNNLMFPEGENGSVYVGQQHSSSSSLSAMPLAQSQTHSSSTIISFGGHDDDDYANSNGASHSQLPPLSNTKVSNKSNNFPPNVRTLLSTGIFDGVPVKYIAWSREKHLPAVIKGSGYLCGCHSCNYSQVINAYEFERHAGCKTKHPNNHIYFENGKTIYGAVQELKTTPQNLLFDALQTVAGSPINQDSFRLWKDSFMAATRELKRIYGNKNKTT